jgi:hypothetical protein
MRVGGDSPGRSSGGSVGDRDEPRAIAGPIYSAKDENCEPSRANTRSSPPGILPAMVSLLSAPPEDGYLSFPFIVTCGWSIAGETENADLLSLRSSKRGGAFYVGSSDCRHLALLRMPAWSECRHAVANNMHALGASLYLAISTVDTVGAQNE